MSYFIMSDGADSQVPSSLDLEQPPTSGDVILRVCKAGTACVLQYLFYHIYHRLRLSNAISAGYSFIRWLTKTGFVLISRDCRNFQICYLFLNMSETVKPF